MAVAVLITGNHFVLDVLAGGGVALLAGGAALLWSWRPRRAPAGSDASDPHLDATPASEVPAIATTTLRRDPP
jgi:membrane-associated phospholipid phosphatase